VRAAGFDPNISTPIEQRAADSTAVVVAFFLADG